jgi:hypothetical protein
LLGAAAGLVIIVAVLSSVTVVRGIWADPRRETLS